MFCCLVRDPAGAPAAAGVLERLARGSSPRVTPCGDDAVLFDATGLSRVCGPPDVMARELRAQAEALGLSIRIALAGTLTAGWILAHARPGSTIVPPGREAAWLAPLPLGWLLTVLDLDRVAGAAGSRSTPERTADAGGDPGGARFRRGRGRNYRLAPAPMGPTPGEGTGGRVGAVPPGGPAPGGDRAQARQRVDFRERLATFERWGIRTCGDLAALPRADIRARMGPAGVRLHQAAAGEDVAPLVPGDEAPLFGDRIELDWPIEGLEPLSFVLARQCDRIALQLEQADRGAVAVHTTLHLVTREVHVRSLALPAPMRDARVLRTLILLDLESHPPSAGIDAVALRLDVAPGRIVQGSLLARAVPSPEQLSTLLARLAALVGSDRVGAPALVDTHDARSTAALVPFRAPREIVPARAGEADAAAAADGATPPLAAVPHLRRFRRPLTVRVTTEHGVPVRLVAGVREWRGGRVRACAGPWRTSGGWWDAPGKTDWDRDEWDVELDDGLVYRLARQRQTGQWEIEGTYD